jgi:glycine/D-amino acid oxidase-like deaminating enzyme
MRTKDAYVAGALSGYGTMGACATGALIAAWVSGERLPDFARLLSLARYDDKALMKGLLAATNAGVL